MARIADGMIILHTCIHTHLNINRHRWIAIIIYSPELVCRRFFDEGLLCINPSRRDDPVNGEG
jgi:hypothetical protein